MCRGFLGRSSSQNTCFASSNFTISLVWIEIPGSLRSFAITERETVISQDEISFQPLRCNGNYLLELKYEGNDQGELIERKTCIRAFPILKIYLKHYPERNTGSKPLKSKLFPRMIDQE